MNDVEDELRALNITEHIQKARPDTKWIPHLITNVTYWITSTNFSLGVGYVKLPDYLVKSKSVVGLVAYKGIAYSDKLCAFRCLTYHRHQHIYDKPRIFEEMVQKYYCQWSAHSAHSCCSEDFEGLSVNDISEFERCFQINVNVFEKYQDESVSPLYLSGKRHPDTLHLNHYQGHLSYISKVQSYSKKFKCGQCCKLFKLISTLKRHTRSCDQLVKCIYPGGYHKPPKTIFQELEERGIYVPPSDRFFSLGSSFLTWNRCW